MYNVKLLHVGEKGGNLEGGGGGLYARRRESLRPLSITHVHERIRHHLPRAGAITIALPPELNV